MNVQKLDMKIVREDVDRLFDPPDQIWLIDIKKDAFHIDIT